MVGCRVWLVCVSTSSRSVCPLLVTGRWAHEVGSTAQQGWPSTPLWDGAMPPYLPLGAIVRRTAPWGESPTWRPHLSLCLPAAVPTGWG